MSKKYQEAMDKIVLSDELKTKIIENVATNHLSDKEKHKKTFYYRYGVGYAACLLLCVLAVFVSKDFVGTNILPSVTNVPSYVLPVPEPTDAIRPEQPTNAVLPENNSDEYQKPVENAEQNTLNHPIVAETQRPQADEPHITTPPETQTPENNSPVPSENHSANEDNLPESSPEGEDNQVASPINPSTDAESFSDVREQLGYDFKVPQYLPEGYKLDTVSFMFGSLVQISYLSENDEIVYRTEKTDADISGDYTVYDAVETVTINNVATTLKSTGEVFYGAVWNDGDMAYSLNSTNGLDKDTMVKIVESTDYPIEQTGEVYEESIVIGEDSTEQYDVNTSDQPTEDIYDDEENDGTMEQSEQIETGGKKSGNHIR